MCGLVGITSNVISAADRKLFQTMLFLDEIRGPHSTGIAAIDRTGTSHIYKRALKASDYLQLDKTKEIVLEADQVLIGHNRYATMGAKDDNNAHPFQHGHITLAHNGTLKSKATVNLGSEVFDTDSETICKAFTEDDIQTVLERLEGAYALSWYDETKDTINLARNDERPLWIGWKKDTVIWSSEKALLELAAAHCKVTLDGIEELPVGQWRAWDVGSIGSGYTEVKFTPKKPVATTVVTTTTSGGKWLGKGKGGTADVGKKLEGFDPEVRQTGYCVAYTDTGDKLTVHLHGKVLQKALRLGKDFVIRGRVSSTYSVNQAGNSMMTYNLSSIGLEVLALNDWVNEYDSDASKCALCSMPINNNDVGEVHHGVTYHTECLDNSHLYSDSHGNMLF